MANKKVTMPPTEPTRWFVMSTAAQPGEVVTFEAKSKAHADSTARRHATPATRHAKLRGRGDVLTFIYHSDGDAVTLDATLINGRLAR